MPFLCLHNPAWTSGPPATLHAPLLTVVPRVVAHADVVWADVRGLPVRATTERVRAAFTAHSALESSVRCGVAATPVCAEVAARHAPQSVTYVRDGYDREFLAPFPVSVLVPTPQLANLLDGAGIECCRDLATLTREEIEVRLGAEGARLWRLARADDPRLVFDPITRTLPEASLEWTDYAIRRVERLVFVVNALFGNVCTTLKERGEGALVVTLRFALVNGTVVEHAMRAGRPTASQTAWMRLARLELERVLLPDAVTGIALRVESAQPPGGRQGDMFDRGFGTTTAAEEALGRVMDDDGAQAVEPENTAHPLLDRRTAWTSLTPARVLERAHAYAAQRAGEGKSVQPVNAPALTLQLLPTPRRVSVSTVRRNGVEMPHRYRDNGDTYAVLDAAGPDRVSGGAWDAPYAREYYRCVVDDGTLVWLFRDARIGVWYMHGWWD